MKIGKIKVAIVGCGRIGTRHAGHASEKADLVAVCDVDRGRSDDLAKKYNALPFYDLDTLLDASLDIDVIAICSPNGLHADQSIKCLKSGHHVLCEKPMALSSYDCGRMIDMAEKANRRLFVVKQNRFNPPVVKLKELLDGESLGQLYSVQLNCFWNRNNEYYEDSNWKGSLDLDGGTLYTQFSHFLDLLIYLFGDIKDFEAYVENYNHKSIIEFEDTGVIIFRFRSGVLGTVNYTVNAFEQNMEGSLSVFGETGTIKIGGKYLNEVEYQKIEGMEISNLEKGNGANAYGNYFGSMSNHDKIYENMVQVLKDGASINTNAFEGLKTVDLIERIYESVRSN